MLKKIIVFAFFIVIVIFNFNKNQAFNLMLDDDFLKYILKSTNHHMSYSVDKKKVITDVVKFLANVDLNDPKTILSDYVLKEEKIIDETFVNESVLEPTVYIYNTHPTEEYASSEDEYLVKPSITMTSYILKEKLSKLGISAIVEENKVSDILQIQNWSYDHSYIVSRMFMESAKEKYNSLKYFIDVHRDSVNKNITTTLIDGKSYARMLFVLGLENTNYEANLEFTNRLNNLITAVSPSLTRGIYKKEGPGVNGVYNQDFSKQVILLEMGGVDNTIDEVYRSTEIFAQVLYDCIGDVK